MPKPLITVILPIYNSLPYLDEAIVSILNQDFVDFELIAINDGSSDGSGERLKFYSYDSRVRIVEQENKGVSAARNLGINLSTTNLITFVDSDDVVASSYLSTLYNSIKSFSADIAALPFTRLNNYEDSFNKRIDKTPTIVELKDDLEHYYNSVLKLKNIYEQVCSKLFHKKLFDDVRFNTESMFEDFEIYPHLILNSKRFVCHDSQLYFYRKTPNSRSSNTLNEKRFLMSSLSSHQNRINLFEQHGFQNAKKKAELSQLLIHVKLLLLTKDKIEYEKFNIEFIKKICSLKVNQTNLAFKIFDLHRTLNSKLYLKFIILISNIRLKIIKCL